MEAESLKPEISVENEVRVVGERGALKQLYKCTEKYMSKSGVMMEREVFELIPIEYLAAINDGVLRHMR